jgi:integrase
VDDPVFKSVFRDEFQELLAVKRSLGFKYKTDAGTFGRIDRFFCEYRLSEKKLGRELCEAWCRKRSHESPGNQGGRISSYRIFARYVCSLGVPAYIPPSGIIKHPPKYDAHIYTPDELNRFFAAVDRSQSVPLECPYRGLVMPVFFRILYTSGMRVSELRLARIRDVDLDKGFVRVVNGKNHKDRFVPIHPELVSRCIALKEQIHSGSPEDEFFFMLYPGMEMTLGNLYKNFRRYLEQAGIPHTGQGPRIHDFRHTYCVNLLLKWTEEGKDLMAYLPYMRTMLGHETFEETAYYLKLTAAAFPSVRKSLDNAFPDIIKEVTFDEREYY